MTCHDYISDRKREKHLDLQLNNLTVADRVNEIIPTVDTTIEPPHGKTNNLHNYAKTKAQISFAVTAKLMLQR